MYLLGEPGGGAALAGEFGFEKATEMEIRLVLWRFCVHGVGRLPGLPPLPASHEERRSPFVSLLIKSEGSGKPVQLISTKKLAPKNANFPLAYSRCKIYQILRIENKSVKLNGYVMLECFVCLCFNLLG